MSDILAWSSQRAAWQQEALRLLAYKQRVRGFAIVTKRLRTATKPTMTGLYEAYLPLVRSLNDYGGNFTSFHIRRPVLDAMDQEAANDPSLASIRDKLNEKMQRWTGLQDHETFSQFFEAYYEGVFYLIARQRGLPLRFVLAGANKGNTPDFTTANPPAINFEVKTIDVADPCTTYDRAMEEGLDAKIEAMDGAKRSGLGIAARALSPHGIARNRFQSVEQVMKKIDSNVKAAQYKAAPTFLVVSTARTAIHDRAENLRKWLAWPNQNHDASGQLFTIAAQNSMSHSFSSRNGAMRSRTSGLSRARVFYATTSLLPV